MAVIMVAAMETMEADLEVMEEIMGGIIMVRNIFNLKLLKI